MFIAIVIYGEYGWKLTSSVPRPFDENMTRYFIQKFCRDKRMIGSMTKKCYARKMTRLITYEKDQEDTTVCQEKQLLPRLAKKDRTIAAE